MESEKGEKEIRHRFQEKGERGRSESAPPPALGVRIERSREENENIEKFLLINGSINANKIQYFP